MSAGEYKGQVRHGVLRIRLWGGSTHNLPPHLLVPSSPPRDARNMAKDVQNTFYDIVAEFGPMEHTQAVDYVKKLMTKGRYSLDVWS